MKVTLKKPPILNHLYGSTKWGGKYLRPKGRAWQEEVMWLLKSKTNKTFTDPVCLTVHLYTCRHQDADGILKILMDTLEKAGVYENDYLVFELHVYKHKSLMKEERVEVECILI